MEASDGARRTARLRLGSSVSRDDDSGREREPPAGLDSDQSAGRRLAPASCPHGRVVTPARLAKAAHRLTKRRDPAKPVATAENDGPSARDAPASRYHEVYARAQRDPEGFWGEAAQAIDWI